MILRRSRASSIARVFVQKFTSRFRGNARRGLPPRLDAVPELETQGGLARLWDHLKKGQKRLHGWFQEWTDIEAEAKALRWYEPLVVPGLLQTEDYARAILSVRPDGNLDDLDEQVAARLARQAVLDRPDAPQLWCVLDEGVLHRAIGGSNGGTCVEVGTAGPAVAVRDSKHPDGLCWPSPPAPGRPSPRSSRQAPEPGCQ